MEKVYLEADYKGWMHSPNKYGVDFTSPDGKIVVQMKSTMSEKIVVNSAIRKLLEQPAADVKILHLVSPPGHVPSNFEQIKKICEQNNIILKFTNH